MKGFFSLLWIFLFTMLITSGGTGLTLMWAVMLGFCTVLAFRDYPEKEEPYRGAIHSKPPEELASQDKDSQSQRLSRDAERPSDREAIRK